eukprot:77758-Chlamydomonas_euryale.AAC.1
MSPSTDKKGRRPKTGFVTPFGQYQFKVLTFGFPNAPATFKAMMSKIFAPLLYNGVLVLRWPCFLGCEVSSVP